MGAMGNYTSDKSNGAAKLAFVQTVEHSNPDPYAKTNKVSLLDLHEWTVVTKELQKRGYTVIRFTADEMNTAEIRRVKLKDLSIRTPVVGTRPSITTCLRHLSVLSMEENPPVLEDYPVSLRAFLHRRVKETTFEEIKKLYESVPTFKAFVKPRGPQKVQSWTGCVISSKDEFWKLTNVKDNTPIYVSEPVNFVDDATGAKSQDTVLVKMNDGYSLGLYPGCPIKIYTNVLLERWHELVGLEVSPFKSDFRNSCHGQYDNDGGKYNRLCQGE